jgi:hypothetical protein
MAGLPLTALVEAVGLAVWACTPELSNTDKVQALACQKVVFLK